MKITDCTWELRNLGCPTAEITVDTALDTEALEEAERTHKYMVVKAPICRGDIYAALARRGYSFIETQITYEKRYRDFVISDPIMRRMAAAVTSEKVSTEAEAEELVSHITPDMFVTDRIYLDPVFGPEYTVRRYRNWTLDMYRRGYDLCRVFFGGRLVGFSCHRVTTEGILEAVLAGSFPDEAKKVGPVGQYVIYRLKEEGEKFNKMVTHVSSNNLPMVKVYNRLGFEQREFRYVFIKHIHNEI